MRWHELCPQATVLQSVHSKIGITRVVSYPVWSRGSWKASTLMQWNPKYLGEKLFRYYLKFPFIKAVNFYINTTFCREATNTLLMEVLCWMKDGKVLLFKKATTPQRETTLSTDRSLKLALKWPRLKTTVAKINK